MHDRPACDWGLKYCHEWKRRTEANGYRRIQDQIGALWEEINSPDRCERFMRKLREARERSGKTHECLAIRVARKLKAINVIDILSDLFILRGISGHIRFDNGPEFVAEAVQKWIAAVGAKTAYIERGRPWENGYIESFNARLPRARSPPSLPERSCPWHPQCRRWSP